MLIVLKNLFHYMRPYKLLAFLFLLAFLIDLTFISLAPLSFKFMVDNAIVPKDIGNFYLILMVLCIAGFVGCSAGIASDYMLATLSARVQKDLRTRLFTQLQHVSIQFFQKTNSADIVSYFSVDLPAIDRAMNAILTVGIQSLSVVVITTAVLFYLQWMMAVCIVIGAIFIFAGPYLLSGRAQEINAAYKEQFSFMTGDVQENSKAQKVVKGFNLQQAMIDKFAARLQGLFVIQYKQNSISASLERIPMISLLLINLTIIGFGSYLALRGHITVGALIAFFTMYTSMGNSVFNLTFIIPSFTDALVSMDRIQKLLDEKLEANNGGSVGLLENQPPDISFENVTFGYNEDRTVLKRVDLHIPKGTTAAFVGSSGSGKSTMVQLILGFYEPNEGQIRLNGSDLQNIDQRLIREKIGIVFQDNFLFRGTILDNIRMSKPEAGLDEVREAAKQAEIDDFIQSLPDGYETEVVDEGSNFSGGQRQRIAIARAILRNPPLLLLDEATSALDPIAEASINRTFAELSRNRTVITVTHRLSAVTDADQIFVFDQGRVVDSGSHEQMLLNGGLYKELWEKQSGLSISSNGQEARIEAERLAKLPFFRDMGVEVLHEIKDLFNTETFVTGQTIIHEGDIGEKFYLIARGRVEVTKRSPDAEGEQIQLAVLGDGDHFGEIALLEDVPRTADVTALTSCVLLTLQRKVLHYVLSQYPELDSRIRQTIKERKK